MAVDLEKLKARLVQINGNKNDNQLLKFAKPGKVTVRIIDCGQAPDGDLFPFREFISLGIDRYVIPQDNAQLRNQISKMQTHYFDLAGKKGTPNHAATFFEVAKKLYPNTNWYASVIVRGEEGKGIQIWKLNKGVYTELVEAFTNEDIGDFMDVKRGFDVDITVAKGGNGPYFFAEHAECARKTSPLAADAALAKQWIEDARNIQIDDLHRKAIKADGEIMAALETYISGGESDKNERTDDKTVSNNSSRELDELVDEIAPKKVKTKVGPRIDTSAAKVAVDDDEDVPTKTRSDLDAQFEDIMSED